MSAKGSKCSILVCELSGLNSGSSQNFSSKTVAPKIFAVQEKVTLIMSLTCCLSNGHAKHCFPNPKKFPQLFQDWVLAVSGAAAVPEDAEKWKLKRVCHRHFTKNYQYGDKRVSRYAVPSLYLGDRRRRSVEETIAEFDGNGPYPVHMLAAHQLSNVEGKPIHRGVLCAECGGEVVGFRYKCVQCPSCDLCAGCEARGAHPHHYVLRIPRPLQLDQMQDAVQRGRDALKESGVTIVSDLGNTSEHSSSDDSSDRSEGDKKEVKELKTEIESVDPLSDSDESSDTSSEPDDVPTVKALPCSDKGVASRDTKARKRKIDRGSSADGDHEKDKLQKLNPSSRAKSPSYGTVKTLKSLSPEQSVKTPRNDCWKLPP